MDRSARGPDGQPLPDVCYQWTFWGLTKAMQCHPARSANLGASAPLPQPTNPQITMGSGFLLKSTNVILTNYHVVENAKQVSVSFPSGETFSGRVIATDRAHDLALVEAEGRPVSAGGLLL